MKKRERIAILKRIRRKVAATHWIKGNYYLRDKETGKDQFCLVGFINCELGMSDLELSSDETPWEVEDDLRDKERNWFLVQILNGIRKRNGSRFRNVEQFNDHPATTREDVLAVLDRAIEQA